LDRFEKLLNRFEGGSGSIPREAIEEMKDIA